MTVFFVVKTLKTFIRCTSMCVTLITPVGIIVIATDLEVSTYDSACDFCFSFSKARFAFRGAR